MHYLVDIARKIGNQPHKYLDGGYFGDGKNERLFEAFVVLENFLFSLFCFLRQGLTV